MTTQIVPATETATRPYSPERFAKMDRADRVTRVMFAARRRGESLTSMEALAIVDAQIELVNAQKLATELDTADVVIVATGAQAANDAGNDNNPVAMAFTRDSVRALVADGRFFSVEFIKRTTGETRQMQARLGVTKHLKGGTKKYSDVSKNLLTVFSVDAKGYRSIPIDGIQSMTVKGTRYVSVA